MRAEAAPRPLRQFPSRVLVALTLAVGLLLTGCVSGTNPASGGGPERASPEARLRAHLDLAEGYIRIGDLNRARLPLDRALEIDARSWEAHDLLGRIHQQEGDIALAERHFRLATRYDSDNPRVRNDYGVFLFEQGRYDEAVEQLRRAIDDPNNPQRALAYENLGLASLREGSRTEARNAFARAVMLDEKRSTSLLELALLAYADADYPQSAAYYQRFRDLARQTPRSLWLGIRLARIAEDGNAEASYALQLRNLYPLSDEYRIYQESRGDG
ncbi:MAG TPA: type IV pilus biogenesis/stability protein PilW [Pseudomonadales bacterium]|nr:type IV pilus biogenesis/stability protein PilW [Pseudomonadales bacterium]